MKTFFSRLRARFAAAAAALALAPAAFAAQPTSVAITSPADNTTTASNAPGITITADAVASSGTESIVSVNFLVNGTSIGTDLIAPYSINWAPTVPGVYALSAIATDSTTGTNTRTSATVSVTVSSVRNISITAPSANATFPQGSSAYVRAAASLSDGVVQSVEFVLRDSGGTPITSLGVDSTSPFNQLTTFSVPAGSYSLVANGTGSASTGSVTFQSLPIPITVVGAIGGAPTVTLATPPSVIAASSTITLSATANDPDAASGGSITGVTFFADGEQIGSTDTTAPYSVSWTPTVVKSYVLTALATDNNSNQSSSPAVTVTVSASAPTVSITAPGNGSAANTGVATTITAAATATSGSTITGVEFFAGGTSLGVDNFAPYSVAWTPSATGTVVLTARATDSNNVSVTSEGVTVIVGNSSLPTISITAPAANATVSTGANINVSAAVGTSAGVTVTSVNFFANGSLIGTRTTAPYAVTWTPTILGATSLTATVVDSAGGTTTSTPVSVNVIAPSGALQVAITGPTSIAAGSTRLYTATVSPASGVDRVEFFLDDTLIATDTTPTGTNQNQYTFLFTAPSAIGAHQLRARVTDLTGQSASSANLTVNVTAATGTPPLVAVSAPSANAFLAPSTATTISGTASDPDGTITNVQVYVNDTLLTGTAIISGGSWSIAWTTPATPGPVSIVAIATDNNSNSVASPALTVTIADSTSPAIVLAISPALSGQTASTTFPSGAVRNFVANVTPAAGRAVVRVEFFVDETKVGEDTSFPFTFRYTAPALEAGQQSRPMVFAARATDNAGAARDVQVPILIVQPIGQPPTVNLITPANGASVLPGSPVSFAASANGVGGTVASVQFYVNGNPAGINNGNAIAAPPYTATWTPTAPGSYVVDAIATDDRGNTTISNSATITAAFATPTVVFNTPNPNAVARGTPGVPLNLTATAVVQAGTGASILLVEFLLDGQQIGADTTATTNNQFSISWTPTTAQLGQRILTARATDTNSQTATSAPITINIANVVGSAPSFSGQPSVQPPAGALGLQTASTVNFLTTVVATGGATLSNVEFFLNDISIGLAARQQASNVYRLTYDFTRFDFTQVTPVINEQTQAVTYPLRLFAIARDSNNNQSVSTTVNLTLNPAISAAPTVQLVAGGSTSIPQGQAFFVQANFNDADGVVTQFQLFSNGTAVTGVLANPQPGQFYSFTPTSAGQFNVYAVVTDDTGATGVSTPNVVLTVNAVAGPTTSVARPTGTANNATVFSPVFLEGTAVNTVTAQVPTLQFIATGASVGGRQVITGIRVGSTTTYRAIWTPQIPDTYTISTQASLGAVQGISPTASNPRVTVREVIGLAPTVTLTRAAGVSGVPSAANTASTADFCATATDPDGSIVAVEFFLNRNSLGQARRDPIGNTWRVTGSFAGLQPGNNEVVALARDSSDNIVASPTSQISVSTSLGIAPSISITPSTTNAAFNRAVQLRANARDSDGNVNSVQYFANATSIGTSTNSGSLFLTSWTPTTSGTYYVWAVATDNSGITRVSDTVEINVRQNNPILENSAFILQTYQDIANTTNINPLVFDQLDEQLANGTLTRADIVATQLTANGGLALTELPGFQAPVNLLAVYYVLMGHWPTPANYTTFLATARNGLANAVGQILFANEYFAKYGIVPTATILNNPNGPLPAQVFLDQLWANAGARPSTTRETDLVRFMSNNVASANIGRGYNATSLNTAIAEFVTNTNAANTALFAKARAAALFYQLARPPITVSVDEITARIDALTRLPDTKAVVDAVLRDQLYGYRYVTITKQPQSLVLAARSGAIFTVEAQGMPPLQYQWLLNGAPIAGATSPTLSLTNVDATRVGTYTVAITSPAAVATSDRATLTLDTTPTKLANISTRGVTTSGANVLIGGFVVTAPQANQTRQMLIRVVGPRLGQAPFNISGFLADPRIEVYSRSQAAPILTNDNWGNQTGGAAQVTAIQQATNRAGAFALGANSNDAVVLAMLPPGLYTVMALPPVNVPNASGVVLIEAYDVTQGAAAAPKAANVSTRGLVGTGNNILIAGFVVDGRVSRRMLIRGAGPTLSSLGVPGVLANPQITLIDQNSGRTLKTNDDWHASGDETSIIASAGSAAGAFPLGNGSRDAAMIVMLPPGAYTVQLSGVGNTTGVGIVEVYDVDP